MRIKRALDWYGKLATFINEVRQSIQSKLDDIGFLDFERLYTLHQAGSFYWPDSLFAKGIAIDRSKLPEIPPSWLPYNSDQRNQRCKKAYGVTLNESAYAAKSFN